MRRETRSKIEIEANRLDMETHRLVGQMEAFAALVRSKPIDQTAAMINAYRVDVRKYMHPDDQRSTR